MSSAMRSSVGTVKWRVESGLLEVMCFDLGDVRGLADTRWDTKRSWEDCTFVRPRTGSYLRRDDY